MANFFIDRPIFASGAGYPVVSDRALAIFLYLLNNIPIWRRPTYVLPRIIRERRRKRWKIP